jgi:hypothetical protein
VADACLQGRQRCPPHLAAASTTPRDSLTSPLLSRSYVPERYSVTERCASSTHVEHARNIVRAVWLRRELPDGASPGSLVNGVTHAGQAPRMAAESRRCALWVNPESFSRAQELADLLGVDVDTFIDFAVTSIHEDVTAEGQLPVRANSRMVTGHVTDLDRFRPRMQ